MTDTADAGADPGKVIAMALRVWTAGLCRRGGLRADPGGRGAARRRRGQRVVRRRGVSGFDGYDPSRHSIRRARANLRERGLPGPPSGCC